MSFDELFEPCFRNVTLVRVPTASPTHSAKDKNKAPAEHLTTLEGVLATSRYVAFALLSSSSKSSADLVPKLAALVTTKNTTGTNGTTSSNNSPAKTRRFFSLKKKKKKEPLEGTSIATVSVVLVDTDCGGTSGVDEAVASLAIPGWFVCTPQSSTTKSRLLRALRFEHSPCVIIVDAATRSVVTSDARRLIAEDPQGDGFPWWSPTIDQALRGKVLVRNKDEEQSMDYGEVQADVRALFFGAFWCPPCRMWLKQLAPVYETLKANGKSFEILFCSSDRSEEAFRQFHAQMPWPALAYDNARTASLARIYGISGIPSLILVDATGTVLSKHGRSLLLSDPEGHRFPWPPQPLYELTELNVARLRDEPSCVLFTEGAPEDVRFALSVLETPATRIFNERRDYERQREDRENDENGNGGHSGREASTTSECSSTDSELPIPPTADPLQFFYTGDDPICDHILERILGLGDAELPLIVILDGLAGQMAVCEQPDVSVDIVNEFVEDYKKGKLDWRPLPTPTATTRTVGGIPTTVIEQALMGSSPSQNNLGGNEQPQPQQEKPKTVCT